MGTVTLEQVYDELKKIEKKMITKEELDSLKDTMEILSNPDTMTQIAESTKDIHVGRVKEVHSVKDLISEL